jgi:molybdopterin synthase sulfur carrier subunit
MRVSVLFFTVLREITAKKEETMEFSAAQTITIGAVLNQLASRYGKRFSEYVYQPNGLVKSFLQFFVNGQSASAGAGLETVLQDGDAVAIVPPVGGG